MDGIAIALHCVHSTTSFNRAVERCINFLGDADSVSHYHRQRLDSVVLLTKSSNGGRILYYRQHR